MYQRQTKVTSRFCELHSVKLYHMDTLTNPIKEARLARGLSQKALAASASMSTHALMRYEQGLYEHISPNLLQTLQSELQVSQEGIIQDYVAFRLETQRAAASLFDPAPAATLEAAQHPFVGFREAITQRAVGSDARIRFCILLAINPAVVLNYDSGKQRAMPHLIKEALLNAGLDETYLSMLDIYGQIWFERYGC